MEQDTLIINAEVTIPLDELRFSFVRSSGPGGQHVNRSATQVELDFDVLNSPSLSEAQRERILLALHNLIDSKGVLHLADSSSRSQYQNRAEVTGRLRELLRRALHVPKARRSTRPSRASREQRLHRKRSRSDIKRLRQSVSAKDE
jgi:ribosome-associated protein